MRIKVKIFFYSSIILLHCNILASDQYPITAEERKWDEIGSFAGEEGLIFRPGKVKNESTKQGIMVNKYLWQASIETLHFIPLASADSNGGIIITEWHTPKNKADYRFKINIFIKDNIISPDAIEVKLFEETLKNNHWITTDSKSNLEFILESKILGRARDIYINTERK